MIVMGRRPPLRARAPARFRLTRLLPSPGHALVTRIADDAVDLTLVNTSQTTPREIVVQGGAYGEHQITTVTSGGETRDVEAPTFSVRLEPGAGAKLSSPASCAPSTRGGASSRSRRGRKRTEASARYWIPACAGMT